MSPDVDNARTGQRNSTDPPRQIHKSSILTWIFLERGFLYSTSNCKNKPSDVESSSVLPHAHSFLQAEGPQCPFGLLVAPCHGAKGKSRAGKAWNVGRNEAVGSREAGVRLFTSPEHCGTHARRAQYADSSAGTRMFPLTNSDLSGCL